MHIKRNKKGFTLLELLLVIAIIAVLAGIIFMALNPAQRLSEANNVKSDQNAKDIEKAIEAYTIDNNGNLPTGFSSLSSYGLYDICKQGQSSNCINIDGLIPKYLPSIPEDKTKSTTVVTGFKVEYEPVKREVTVYSNKSYDKYIASETTLTKGLVGYWKVDEASWNGTAGEVIDSSGNENNGTKSGGASIITGKYGNAGYFDSADDIVSVNDSNSLDLMRTMTISVWVKANSWGNYSVFAGKEGNYVIRTRHDGSYLQFVWWDENGNVSANGSPVPSTGNWHNIVGIVVNDNITSLYVDNQLVAGNGVFWFNAPKNLSNPLQLGSNGYANFLNGSLDDIRIYNRGLNAEEVKALYLWGPQPVVNLKFEENQGYTTLSSTNDLIGSTTNLITNPSLETNINGWGDFVYAGPRTITQSSERSVYGTKSIKIVSTAGFQLGTTVDALPNTQYSFSGWMYVEEGNNLNLMAKEWTSGNGFIKDTIVGIISVGQGWRKLSTTITTGASTGKISIAGLKNNSGAGTYYLDALQIEQTSRATPYCDGSIDRAGNQQWNGTAHASTSTCDYGIEGDINGAVWQDGKIGKALSFDGVDDYVNLSSMGTLIDFPNDFTISAWLNLNSVPPIYLDIIGSANNASYLGSGKSGWILAYRSDNGLRFGYQNNYDWVVDQSLSSGVLSGNKWYYITLIRQGTNITFYLDGAAKGTFTNSANLVSTEKILRIGGGYGSVNNLFNGQIDDVRIYNYARTPGQILKDMNNM